MGCSVVPSSMSVLAFLPAVMGSLLCLSLVSRAVSGWVLDASAKPWFIETGSEDVSGNEFDFGFSLLVSVPS